MKPEQIHALERATLAVDRAHRDLDAFIDLMADLRHHPIQSFLRPIDQKLHEAVEQLRALRDTETTL